MSCVSKGIGNQPKQTVPGAPIKKTVQRAQLRPIGTEQLQVIIAFATLQTINQTLCL
jgi:hypothetical protein